MQTKLILIGAGGHCRACIDVIGSSNIFSIEGILGKEEEVGGNVLTFPVIGNDSAIEKIAGEKKQFLITVGQIGSAAARVKLYQLIKKANGIPALVIARTALVSSHSSIGEGTIIMHHAIVNTGASVGINNIINNKALIEHDSRTGDHCHISTGAIINGDCRVGNRVFIGSQSVLIEGIRIADDVVIGAGSVVLQSISSPGIYAGNPAKKIK